MSRSPGTRFLAALATAVFLLAACGGDGAGDTAAGGTEPTGATAEDDAMGGYGTGGNDTGGDTGAGGGTAAGLQANNFSFDPTELDVAAGSELEVRNGNASTPHTFTVDGTDVDVELAPLASESVTIDLDPGKYDFACRFHPQMTGTLAVT
jgi:plastocyanin